MAMGEGEEGAAERETARRRDGETVRKRDREKRKGPKRRDARADRERARARDRGRAKGQRQRGSAAECAVRQSAAECGRVRQRGRVRTHPASHTIGTPNESEPGLKIAHDPTAAKLKRRVLYTICARARLMLVSYTRYALQAGGLEGLVSFARRTF